MNIFSSHVASTGVFIAQFNLDWVSRNWYFLDSINNFVFICSYDMQFCRIIIRDTKSGAAKLRGFAIDPSAGFIFTTKHDPESRVGAVVLRFSGDGSQMKSLLQEKLFFPYHVTLDVAMKRLLFLDHFWENFIQQIDYEGGSRRFLQRLPLIRFCFKDFILFILFYKIHYFFKVSPDCNIREQIFRSDS